MKLPLHLTAAATPVLALIASAAVAAGQNAEVTFVDHVGPLIHRACVSCHRPGQAAPFSLLSYEDSAKRAAMILEVVEAGYMPPWPPSPGPVPFTHELRLARDEVQLLRDWISAGKPRGQGELAPPEFASGWALGEPDLVLEMPLPYDVLATGPDVYRSFVFPLDFNGDRWVRALEFRPSAPAVVHHALFFSAESASAREADRLEEGPGFLGMPGQVTGGLGGYVPGSRPQTLPDGLAFHVPKGNDLVVQVHFHPSGKKEVERSAVGIYFAEEPPTATIERLALPALFGIGENLSIPAGVEDHRVRCTVELPVDAYAHVVSGHAHYLCRQMELHARLPGGSSLSLLRIDDWDIDWQGQYTYAERVPLPAGTELVAEFLYDNSEGNPDNPYSPPRDVRWGRETTDEMASLSLLLTASSEDDTRELRALGRRMQLQAVRSFLSGPSEAVLRTLDQDGNGLVERKELPGESRGFRLLDRNNDNALSLEELRRFSASKVTPPVVEQSRGPTVTDLDGAPCAPFGRAQDRAAVAVFITTDCPIANQYHPELAQIAAEFGRRGVQFSAVYVDPSLADEDVRRHVEAYGVSGRIVVDRGHELVRQAGVTMTPEVAVFGHDGSLQYRGRIDDRFPTLGDRRIEPSRRDLRAALEELLSGKGVSVPRTSAVGCRITESTEDGR